MDDEANPPRQHHSPPNSAAAATPKSVAAAAAAAAAAIKQEAKSMKKCKKVFRSLRKYRNAKLLNVIKDHGVDLNTIAGKLKEKSYSEPREFAIDVRSALAFGSKSRDRIVKDVTAKMLAKFETEIGPIMSEWLVVYWGSLVIEGTMDEQELNDFVGDIAIDSEDLMSDDEIAGLEDKLPYYEG